MRSSLATLSRSQAWTVEAREPVSTTSTVFANAARISLALPNEPALGDAVISCEEPLQCFPLNV